MEWLQEVVGGLLGGVVVALLAYKLGKSRFRWEAGYGHKARKRDALLEIMGGPIFDVWTLLHKFDDESPKELDLRDEVAESFKKVIPLFHDDDDVRPALVTLKNLGELPGSPSDSNLDQSRLLYRKSWEALMQALSKLDKDLYG